MGPFPDEQAEILGDQELAALVEQHGGGLSVEELLALESPSSETTGPTFRSPLPPVEEGSDETSEFDPESGQQPATLNSPGPGDFDVEGNEDAELSELMQRIDKGEAAANPIDILALADQLLAAYGVVVGEESPRAASQGLANISAPGSPAKRRQDLAGSRGAVINQLKRLEAVAESDSQATPRQQIDRVASVQQLRTLVEETVSEQEFEALLDELRANMKYEGRKAPQHTPLASPRSDYSKETLDELFGALNELTEQAQKKKREREAALTAAQRSNEPKKTKLQSPIEKLRKMKASLSREKEKKVQAPVQEQKEEKKEQKEEEKKGKK